MRLKHKSIYGIVIVLVCTTHIGHATAKVKTLYHFGMGTGKMTIQGAFNVQQDVNVFSAAVDYHDESTFMYLGGSASTRSEIDNMRILVGGGNHHLKMGSGLMRLSTTLPTVYQRWGLFNANPNFTTEASIIGIPLYFRWTPLSTEKWLINLDGFYTVASKGELQIPIAGTGHPSGNIYLRSSALKTKSNYGSSLSINYHINHDLGVQLKYLVETGQVKETMATIPGDPLSALRPTKVPAFEFRNQMVMLSAVMLMD